MSDIPPPPPPPPPGGMPPPPVPAGAGTPGNVPIGEAFSYGWNKFTADVGPWILMALALFVIGLVGSFIRFVALAAVDGFFGLILQFVLGVVLFVLLYAASYGIVRAALLVTDGERPNPSKAWQMDQFGPYLVASILVGIIVTIGYILCVVPGVIAQFLLMFTPYFVIDKKIAPVEAMKASSNLVSKHIGGLIGFLLLAWLVMFLGVITCLVGMLIAFPVTLVATAYVYKRLDGRPVAP